MPKMNYIYLAISPLDFLLGALLSLNWPEHRLPPHGVGLQNLPDSQYGASQPFHRQNLARGLDSGLVVHGRSDPLRTDSAPSSEQTCARGGIGSVPVRRQRRGRVGHRSCEGHAARGCSLLFLPRTPSRRARQASRSRRLPKRCQHYSRGGTPFRF